MFGGNYGEGGGQPPDLNLSVTKACVNALEVLNNPEISVNSQMECDFQSANEERTTNKITPKLKKIIKTPKPTKPRPVNSDEIISYLNTQNFTPGMSSQILTNNNGKITRNSTNKLNNNSLSDSNISNLQNTPKPILDQQTTLTQILEIQVAQIPQIPEIQVAQIPHIPVRINVKYEDIDKGPYILIIESFAPDGNIGRVHRMSLGKILHNHPAIKPNDILEIDAIGKNRIKLQLTNSYAANNILSSEFLKHKYLKAYIPESILCRKGVIRNVDTSINNDEIKEVIKSEVPIIDIRRITRKTTNHDAVQVIDTETVILNFRGQILPQYVSIYGAKCKVTPYVYKVRQCLNCLRFGHIAPLCKSATRCLNCGENHPTDQCNENITTINCVNCKGPHSSTDTRNCPMYNQQTEIKKYMAYNNVGFKEAKTKYRQYSQVAAEYINTNNTNFPPLHTDNRFNILNTITSDNNDHITDNQSIQQLMSKPRRNSIPRHNNRYENKQTNGQNNRYPSEPSTSHQPIHNPYPPQPHLNNAEIQSTMISKAILQIIDVINKLKSTNPTDLAPHIQKIINENLPD